MEATDALSPPRPLSRPPPARMISRCSPRSNLSKLKWVVTINSPGSEKFSKHGVVEGGDGACLLDLLSRSRAKAEQRYGVRVKTVVIQEAELDGFHRLLVANGIESHVVDAASIAVDRRHRRAKTDSIDGETLLRTLMAWARGERRVCCSGAEPGRRGSPAPDAPARRAAQGTHSAYQSDPGRAAKAPGITIRFGEIVSNGSRRCEPATAVSCRR